MYDIVITIKPDSVWQKEGLFCFWVVTQLLFIGAK